MDRQQMLQEIQEAILKKIYPDLNISEAIFKYGCINEVKYSDEWGSVCAFSLSRVLSALGYKYKIIPLHDNLEYNYYIDTGKEKSIKRKLLNEDGSDAYLDDQSERTIEALHKLLVRK